MGMSVKQRIASGALALALLGGTGASIAAQETDQTQRGGAAGLIAAVAQIQADNVVSVEIVDSFNNLRALNNILNNNDIDVTVGDVALLTDFLNDNNITLEDFLNDNNIILSDIVAIDVLDTGDLIVFV